MDCKLDLDLTHITEWPGKWYVAVEGWGGGNPRFKPLWEVQPHEYFMDRSDWWAQRKQLVFGAREDLPPTAKGCTCPGCSGKGVQ